MTVTGGTSPKGATVGAGVTVVIKQFQYVDARGASFINHGTVQLEQNAALYGPLTNDGTVEDTGTIPEGNNRPTIIGSVVNSGTIRADQGLNLQRNDGTFESTGTLATATADALLNGTGYTDSPWTISGTVTNPGLMQFQAGTMRVRALTTQTGNPFRTYDSKLDLTGATGATVETDNTVDLTTNIPAGVTVRVTGRTNDGYLRLDADHTNNGTLVFDSTDQFRATYLTNVSASARLTNAGTLRFTGVTGADRNVRIPITNTAAGTISVDAGNRMVFQNDAGETITAGTWNANGNVWIQGGSTSPAQITQTGGTITVASGVSLFVTTGGRYVHQGGTTAGELQFQNGSTIDASGPGAATYHVVGYVMLADNVNAAATINLEAGGGQPANLTLIAPSTMAGRMTFTTGGANAQDTEINGGQRLTVTGRIDVLRGQGGTRHFKVPLTLAATGQFNVEALSTALLDVSNPSALRYGWIATATLSLRNAGANDVGIDGVRFVGTDLELRAPGTTTFGRTILISDTDLGDAPVIPALSTRTVTVEVRSTTVGHAFMGLDAEVYPAGYLSQTITGSDPDPGTGSINGHVTNASGQPVRGLLVSGFDGSHSASATTDGSGAYTLKALKPGTYKVEAGGASGSAVVNQNARSVDLVTGVADISGTVGKGDATVALLRAGKAVAMVAADATGGFRFRIAKAGAYTLVADSPSGGRASQAVTVVAGVDQPGLRLTLGTRALNVTAGSGAVVRVWPAGEQDLPSSRTAGAEGVASFTGLGAGALTVEARAAGKAPTRATVAAGATAVTVTPGTAASISGLVTAGATPVVGSSRSPPRAASSSSA